MDDVLIRGGLVVDGSGGPGRTADVAVRDGRITAIEPAYAGQAWRVVEAAGFVVAPGFIDIHTHSDFTLPLNPLAESKIRQGVTTEVVGNRGYSVGPALAGRIGMLRDYLASSAPWLEFREASFPEYLDAFPPTAVNTVMQVGHNTLRLMVLGLEDRPAQPDELARMERLLEAGLEAGAIGLSSGLFTAPGSYATSEELLALGRVPRRHGANDASHVRDEANQVFEAVREAIGMGEAADVHVQVAHLKLSGTDNWGGAERLLEEVAQARRGQSGWARRARTAWTIVACSGKPPSRYMAWTSSPSTETSKEPSYQGISSIEDSSWWKVFISASASSSVGRS